MSCRDRTQLAVTSWASLNSARLFSTVGPDRHSIRRRHNPCQLAASLLVILLSLGLLRSRQVEYYSQKTPLPSGKELEMFRQAALLLLASIAFQGTQAVTIGGITQCMLLCCLAEELSVYYLIFLGWTCICTWPFPIYWVYDPVCGDNGRNYASPCAARCYGVEQICDGYCPCRMHTRSASCLLDSVCR